MRMMMRARLDTQVSNQTLQSGKMLQLLESTMDRIHPEAAYFCPQEGGRTCIMVFDMKDASQMPSIAEPFFQELGAEVDFEPVMNREDLKKGLAALS